MEKVWKRGGKTVGNERKLEWEYVETRSGRSWDRVGKSWEKSGKSEGKGRE